MLDGQPLKRCPRRPYLDDPRWYEAIFAAWRYRKAGFLGEVGTWRDQPVKMLAALDVVTGAFNEAERIKVEKEASRRASEKAHARAQARAKGAHAGPRR